MWSYDSGWSRRQSSRSCSSVLFHQGLSRQLVLTTTAPVGPRSTPVPPSSPMPSLPPPLLRKASIGSVRRVGFHENQISEPCERIVGRRRSRDFCENVCASSTQARL